MRPLKIPLIAALAAGAAGSATPTLAQTGWTNIKQVYSQHCTEGSERWTICGLYYVTQSTPSAGGPQGLEGYVLVDHPAGTVGLAIGTLGNVEIAGAGDVTDVRPLQGGLIVSGPGTIHHAAVLTLGVNRKGGYNGPINIERLDYVVFPNGASIRADGDGLVMCDRYDHCR